ncbi:MAG: hypothetical protein AAF763_08560 [Pseudomonadota bacterium]
MNVVVLLIGALLALPLFLALIFSLARAASQTGRLRQAHAAAVALTLAMMAAVSLEAPLPAAAAGLALALTAAGGVWLEDRWNKALPLFQCAAGLAVAFGLPFA